MPSAALCGMTLPFGYIDVCQPGRPVIVRRLTYLRFSGGLLH